VIADLVLRSRLKAAALLLPIAVAVACAGGSEGDGTGDLGSLDGDGGTGGGTTRADGSTTEDGGVIFLDADLGGNSDDGGGTNEGGMTGGGMDAGDTCGYPTTCQNATSLGSLSGDTSPAGNSITKTGSSSDWFTVYVTEDNHSLFNGRALTLSATLSSPPGANYDIYAYRNGGGMTPIECTNVGAMSMLTSGDDVISLKWGEGSIPNGSDDSALITIRIQHVSGPCDSAHEWKLTLVGNP
jgi:hypothetical protein